MMEIVLASTSRYRRHLLSRLGLPFIVDAPDVDESRRAGETPIAMASRLAEAKARVVGGRHPGCLVIGSDQVVAIGARLLGKPGDADTAREQLAMASGHSVDFHTALCVVNADSGRTQLGVDTCRVTFRTLSASEIARYVELDAPFDCAGAFRSEGLGIALIERIQGDDPNALVGLPLIRLIDFLAREGISPLDTTLRGVH